MIRNSFAAVVAASAAALALACTASTEPTPWTDPNATEPSSSSGGSTSGGSSSGKTSSSSSSGGKTSSSSGGSSSGGSSSGGSSSGKTSSSGGSTSSSGGTSTSSSGGTSTSSSGGTSTSSSSGGTGLCPDNQPLTSADLDAEIGWKSAQKKPGACSATDLTTLENNFQSTTIATYLDLGTGLSASCKACAISYDTDTYWQPIVATQADGGATGFVNFGACFGNVEGAACGKALQYEQFCYNIACNACTTTSTQRQQCISVAGATGGMCNTFGNTTGTACPNITTTATSCNSVIDSVKYLCQ